MKRIAGKRNYRLMKLGTFTEWVRQLVVKHPDIRLTVKERTISEGDEADSILLAFDKLSQYPDKEGWFSLEKNTRSLRRPRGLFSLKVGDNMDGSEVVQALDAGAMLYQGNQRPRA